VAAERGGLTWATQKEINKERIEVGFDTRILGSRGVAVKLGGKIRP